MSNQQRRYNVVTTDDMYQYEEQQEQAAGTKEITLPKGIQFYSLPKDTKVSPFIRVDILPFVTETANGDRPIARANYFVHRNIDGNRTNVICPHSQKGLPCPVCEYGNALSWEDAGAFRPQKRQMYAVVFPDSSEPEKIWVLDLATWSFGRLLDEKIKSCDPKDPQEMKWHEFADLQSGWSLKINLGTGTFAGNSFTNVTSIDFKPRTKPYSEDWYDKVPDLYKALNILPYEDIKSRFRPSAMVKRDGSTPVSTATAVQHAVANAAGQFDPTAGYNPMVPPTVTAVSPANDTPF